MIINFPFISRKRSCKKESFLVILFGTYEFDGRVQRLVEILKDLGHVIVVDIATSQVTKQANEDYGFCRLQIFVPKHKYKIRRHLLFWLKVIRIALRKKPSIIVAEDFYTTLLGWVSAKFCNAKLIYDAHELIIPDPTRKMDKRDCFWYLLEKWTVRRTDLVIAANQERANIMAEHYYLKNIPVVMQNIPSTNSFKNKLLKEEVLKKFPSLSRSSQNEVLVIYQGEISLSRGIERFVLALDYLGPQFKMIIVGSGPDFERIRPIGEKFEREGRLIILGRVEHKYLLSITTLADVGIITYPFHGLNNIYCASNKLFEYAMAGLPVISTNQPPLKYMIEKYEIGKLINEQDYPDQIAKLIQEIAEKKNKYKKFLINFLKNHRWEDEAKKIKLAVSNILSIIS
jgi:glycosyltransferase involved in cell wall biosynthesis